MSVINPIPGQANVRTFTILDTAGAEVTTGTPDYYLYALTGTNAGKHFRTSDNTWQIVPAAAGTLVYVSNIGFTVSVDAEAWTDGVEYVETFIPPASTIKYHNTIRCEYPQNLKYILGTLLTETAGYLAAGFKKFFNIATPVLTVASVNQTADGDVKKILGTAPTEGAAGRLAAGFTKQYDVATPVFTAESKNQTGDSYAKLPANFEDMSIVDTTGVVTATVTGTPTVTLANGAHGGGAATITLQTPIAASGNWNTVTPDAAGTLAAALPTNFAAMAITVGGVVSASGNWSTFNASTDKVYLGNGAHGGAAAALTLAAPIALESTLTAMKGAGFDSTNTLEAIHDDIAAITGVVVSGAGLPTLTMTIKDTNTSGAAISGVIVKVYDSTDTTFVSEGITNGSGIAAITLPADGTYGLRLYKAGYTMTAGADIVVSGNTAAERYGVAFTAGTPSPATVRVYSWEFEADGATAISGAAVSAKPVDKGAYHASGGMAHADGYKAEATTNVSGYWYLDLYPGKEYYINVEATREKTYRLTTPVAGSAATQMENIATLA